MLVSAQYLLGQNYWAHYQAGDNVDETLGSAADDDGYTYATGYYSTAATVNNVDLVVNGLSDVYVSKVAQNGSTEWSFGFGGVQSDRGLAIDVDQVGNVLVCGFYTGMLDFGNGIILNSNSGSQDAFVLKLDSNGSPVWARSGGSSGGSDRANAIGIDPFGNVIITGQFSGDAQFGSLNLNSTDGTNDVFIVKYNSEGNELWAKKGTGASLDRGLAITTDNQGGVYATGQFSGDITFDNIYPNNSLNAFYLIKYSPEGLEEWFRWASGTEDCIAYGLTSDGDHAYLTGDFGASMSVLGLGIPITISSGYSESIFILSFDSEGDYNWGSTAGSESLVSSRAIDERDGELAIVGWYNCTFDSYSAEYGEATFNSIGFKDAFMARYDALSGDFSWSRNFGSHTDEEALTVAITSDGYEVVGGVFTDELVLPINGAVLGSIPFIPLSTGTVYCGDDNYGSFIGLGGADEQDGFLIKVLDQERLPYDYQARDPAIACDFSIPNSCINYLNPDPFNCQDSVIACPSYNLWYSGMTVLSEYVGYGYTVNWQSPSGSNTSFVTEPGEFVATSISNDGCYTKSDTIFADLYPEAQFPLISDNSVVNDSVLNTEPIFLCPGDSVSIWGHFPDTLNSSWTSAVTGNQFPGTDTIIVSEGDEFILSVSNQFGCGASNDVYVQFLPTPENLAPIIDFPYSTDTLTFCINDVYISVEAFIEGTTDYYPAFNPYNLNWNVEPSSGIGPYNPTGFGTNQEGWHVVTLITSPVENQCHDVSFEYTVTDSIYIALLELPEVEVNVDGPEVICFGDTLVAYIDYSGNLYSSPNVFENFIDSVYITQPGSYSFSVDSTGANGCYNFTSSGITVSTVSTPQIFSNPPDAVICPGDSVQVLSFNEGEFLWQGPSGNQEGSNSTWVSEPGLYFAEVTFYEGCALVSNTVQISEYSTPFLLSEDGLICEGGSEQIWVVSNSLETVEWLPPLSGNDSIQVVTDPGVYSVSVFGCGVTTEISIEILPFEPEVVISLSDSVPVCVGDSLLVIATGNFDEYIWSPEGDGVSQWFSNAGPVSVSAVSDDGCKDISNTLNLTFEPIPPDPTFQFELPCEGEPMEILVSSNLEVNVLSGLGGFVISTDSIQEIEQLSSDTTIYVFLASPYCNGDTMAIDLSPKPYPAEPIPSTDAPVCTGTNLTLEILNVEPDVEYIWLVPNGDFLNGDLISYGIYDLTQAGEYLAYADLEDCLSDTVGIEVSLFETRQVNLPPDTALCFRPDFMVAPDTLFESYLWSDGSTDSIFNPELESSLTVSLAATDFNGCRSLDIMIIEFADCIIQSPNVITPNGDGINDEWIVGLDQPQFFDVVIYNRWGRLVYESKDFSSFWDGTNYKSGELCSEGVYFYIIRVNDFEGRAFDQQGDITIIRD